MPSTSSNSDVDPHLLKSDLSLSIVAVPADLPTIRATITNFHPETSITLLKWDTPLDDLAVKLGLVHMTDLSNGKDLKFPEIKIKRKLPPPDDAFYELLPQHAVTKDIVLAAPGLELERNKEYEVQVRGYWKAVWHANAATVGSERLKQMGGGDGFWRGEFASERITLTAP